MRNSICELQSKLDAILILANERDKLRTGFKNLGITIPIKRFIQTGYIYFIQDTECGLIKIGWAKDPYSRMTTLQTGAPNRLILLGAFEGTIKDEKTIHNLMKNERTRGEWFKDNENIRQYVKERNTLINSK